MKLLFDLFPVILFFVAYKFADIYVATAVAIGATVAQIAWVWFRHRKVDTMLWVSLGLIAVLGGMTLALRDETFIKIKPTIIYGIFGVVLAVGLAMGRSLIALVFDQVLELTEEGWRRLTLRWMAFFFAMAALNEIVWRTQTTDFWVAFKLFGVVPLTFVFAVAQYPLMKRFEKTANDAPAGEPPDQSS